jgi:hypothetical protein
VTYDHYTVDKHIVKEENLYKADINTMGSKIGWITNIGTSLYALLPLFEEGSEEYKEIIKRLILVRKLQGCEIDKAKTGYAKPIPKWDKWMHVPEDATKEDADKIAFQNKLVVNRRPKFMIYLYPDYMRKYKNHRDIYENYCMSIYGYSLDTLLNKKDRNSFEQDIYEKYHEFNPFIDSDSVMGTVCRYMENSLEEIKLNLKDEDYFDPQILMSSDFEIDEYKLRLMLEAYKQFMAIKKGIYDYDDNSDSIGHKIEELNRWCYERISENQSELADLAVYVSYYKYKGVSSRDFCWKVFGDEIINNLIANGYDRAKVPLIDEFGDIHYLGKRYSHLGVKITE